MKHRVVALSRKPFVRNVGILASGSILAQAISFALMPVVTRLFAPEALGVLGVFLSITSVTMQIAALSYPMAMVLPKEDRDALGIARLSLIIAAATSLIACIIVTVFDDGIVRLLKLEAIRSYLFLVPIAMFANALMAVADQWAVRKQLFKAKAAVLTAHSFLLNASKVMLGFIAPLASGLVVLTTLGYFVQAALLLFAARRGADAPRAEDFTSAPLRPLAKRHIDFPLFRAPEQLLNAVSVGLPILMLASLFSPTEAGYFALAMSALSAPTILLGKSVSDVFYPRLSQASHNSEKLTPMIWKATVGLFWLGAPIYLSVILFGPQLFSFIFGANWEQSGAYARWIAPWMLMLLVNKPAITSSPVLLAQKFLLAFMIISAFVRFLVLYIAYYIYESAVISIALFSFSGVILNVTIISILLFISRTHDSS